MKRLISSEHTINNYNDLLTINNEDLLKQLSKAFLIFVKSIDLDDTQYFSFVSGFGMMFRQSDKQMANPIHLTQLFAEGNEELSDVINNVLKQNGINTNYQYDNSDSPFLQKLMTYNFADFQRAWQNVIKWYEENCGSLNNNAKNTDEVISIRDLADINDKINDLHDVKIDNYAGAFSRTCGFTIKDNHIYDSHHGAVHMHTKQQYDIAEEDKDDANTVNAIYGVVMDGAGIISYTSYDEATTIKKVQEAYKKSDVHYKIYFQTSKGLLRIAKNKCYNQRLLSNTLQFLCKK